MPSKSFQKWLSLATGHDITSHDTLLRRFRRGQDYTLATGYDEESPRIELCLGLTPTPGWGDGQATASEKDVNGEKNTSTNDTLEQSQPTDEESSVGGYLAYMAGDEDHDEGPDSDTGSDHGIEVPLDMSTGARSSKATNPKKAKQDPAIYQSNGDDEDDGVLFSMPAGWNRLGIALRDKGTMRFVKYVSRMAQGDRWDIVGEFQIVDVGEDDTSEESVGPNLNAGLEVYGEESGDDLESGDEESESDE